MDINLRLKNIKELQAKRWDHEDQWDELNENLIQDLHDILRIDPLNTSTLVSMGAIYSDMGENEKALYCLKAALKLGSEDKNLFVNLGIVLIYMQRPEYEYLEYIELSEDKTENPLTFKAYFDPHAQ